MFCLIKGHAKEIEDCLQRNCDYDSAMQSYFIPKIRDNDRMECRRACQSLEVTSGVLLRVPHTVRKRPLRSFFLVILWGRSSFVMAEPTFHLSLNLFFNFKICSSACISLTTRGFDACRAFSKCPPDLEVQAWIPTEN